MNDAPAAPGPTRTEPPYQVKDPEAFARNMARLAEEGGKVLAAIVEPHEREALGLRVPEEFGQASKTLGQVVEKWLSNPQAAFAAQTRLWTGYLGLWTDTLRRMSAGAPEPEPAPAGDKRFADEAWAENPMFDFLRRAYLLTSQWAEQVVEEVEGLEEHERHKARFYVKQFTSALSPSNFVLTNPELLRETLETNGENLVRGMRMMAEDVQAGSGQLKIRQTDPGNFEVGRNLAVTPGKVIFQNDLMQLIQYTPSTESVYRVPLVIVPPWINKFYILDLTPEKSFIKWAVDQGLTVFVVSWVNPDARLAAKSFEDYMRDGILKALDVAGEVTGEDKAHLIGYCVGGTLLSSTLGYMAATGDERAASTTLLATQVDFAHAGDLKVFADEEQITELESQMARAGYLEGGKMASAFNMLRANDLIWSYYVNNYLKGKPPSAFDLLYWNSDSTRMPAANHSFYLRNCYLSNKLSKGEMELGGIRIDLKKVKVPIYNLATREDHIAPPNSVFLGCNSFGGPVRFVLTGSGHIAGVVNPPSRNKYQYWVGGKPTGDLDTWFAKAKEHPGSWWPDWLAWILKQGGKAKVPARVPGAGSYEAIEDAPGSYVKVRA
ncbi:class I poly(R)-hydroxyalkanoic acid synthase [Lutibaculum baratangense]|nr:class I poly(R)-hydroxyalkanoic acid synthase [Lutibaculum baratangense]